VKALLAMALALLIVGPAVGQIEDGKVGSDAGSEGAALQASKSSASTPCQAGFSGPYPCLNVDLVSFMPRESLGAASSVRLNDLWGWEDPQDGRLYVLLGREDGTAFVDITDPGSPRFVGELPMTPRSRKSVWRDIKVYQNFAFIVADGAGPHGMQVFDLEQLRGASGPPKIFSSVSRYEGFGSAHNVVINEASGFAYAVGSSGGSCSAGLHMIDISNPRRPLFAGCFQDSGTRRGYSHDAQCVQYQGPDVQYQDREICIGSNEDAISIVDVSDKARPRGLGVGTYPTAGYVHQGWLTEDHRYFYQNDELDERVSERGTRTLIWDVQDLEDPQLVGEFGLGTTSIDHNLYVKGDYLYEANYTSGLQIMDIADPTDPVRVAYFDTTPSEDAFSFNGTWSVYPYFSDGTIALSSREEGLFLLRATRLVVTRVGQFDADVAGDGVRFAWTMESQQDVATFELERLLHAEVYEVFAELPGSGTVESPANFEIMATGLPEGVSLVRLVAVSLSGQRSALLEKKVFVVPGTHVLGENYPNPTAGRATITLVVAEPQRVSVGVYDASGRLVSRLHNGWVSDDQELTLELDASSWPGGTYWIRFEGDRFSNTRTLVVTR
jgi:choice-of-anchor B domain-containing protein